MNPIPDAPRPTTLRLPLDDGDAELQLRPLPDGRLAWTARTASGESEWHVLARADVVALAGWLAEVVAEGWCRTLRRERPRLGTLPPAEVLWATLPSSLRCRALLALLSAVGPELRDVRVRHLNTTADPTEERRLRDAVDEAAHAFAQVFAAATALCRDLPADPDGHG